MKSLPIVKCMKTYNWKCWTAGLNEDQCHIIRENITLSQWKTVDSIKTKTGLWIYSCIYYFLNIMATTCSRANRNPPQHGNDCNSRPQKQGTVSPQANTKHWVANRIATPKVKACLPKSTHSKTTNIKRVEVGEWRVSSQSRPGKKTNAADCSGEMITQLCFFVGTNECTIFMIHMIQLQYKKV